MSDIIAKLVEAIGQLDPEKEGHFTQAGIPNVEQLEAVTGIATVTAEERDTAWAIYQKNEADAKAAADAEAKVKADKEAKDKADAESQDKADARVKKMADDEAEAKEKAKADGKAKKKAKAKRDPGFYVCDGKAVTSRKGIRGPGDPVTPEHFRGEGTLQNLVERGIVEEVK